MNKTFGKLNQINVNEDTEKKGKFTYLSWSHAWKYVQKNSENASFELLEDIVYPDGTREVRCSVTIDGATHTMWLAVTDHNNRAIKNPDARAVGDSRMRCLVKAIALHGLGLYIYAKEGVPERAPDPEPENKPPRKNPDISVHPLEPEVQTFELYNRDGTIRDTFNDENHYTAAYLELLTQAQNAGANADMIDQFKEANKNTIDKLGSNNQTKIQDKTKWARTQASVSK
jgi:hypothetical protein